MIIQQRQAVQFGTTHLLAISAVRGEDDDDDVFS
jgi:hypothetical protein